MADGDGPGKGNGDGSRPSQFQKGHSGNPGGRPKYPAELWRAAQALCPEALQILVSIARNLKLPAGARVMAANSILDRGLGKPKEHVRVDMFKNAAELTDDELAAIAFGSGADAAGAPENPDEPGGVVH